MAQSLSGGSGSFGQEDEDELENILVKAGLIHLKSNFVEQKVCPRIIQFLENKDWERLGVTAIGDRIVLAQMSKARRRDETLAKEVRDIFGPHPSSSTSSSPSSKPSSSSESFAHRAERLCGSILASRRRSKRSMQSHRVKEFIRNVCVIDFQGTKLHKPIPLYDYQKIFDGPVRILSDMTEPELRQEIVRVVKLKTAIPTHDLHSIEPDSFNFVKVYNRRVREIDGDVPCDGAGISHIYRNGSIYVRLKDTSLWSGDQKLYEDDEGEPDPHEAAPSISRSGQDSNVLDDEGGPDPHEAGPSTSRSGQESNVADNFSTFINLISDDDEVETDDPDLRLAIQNSLLDQSSSVPDLSLPGVLKEHITSVVQIAADINDLQRVTVRRQAIWRTTLRCLQNPSFQYSCGLNVVFIPEEAVDAGGPLREFFRLVLKSISSNNALLCGPECFRTLMHNAAALDKLEFLYIGRCIVMSIMYGGPGPHFFGETAAKYLLDVPIESVPLEEVPDRTIVERIKQIENCETSESMRELLDSPEFSFRFDCGVTVPSSTLSIDDKAYVCKCIAMHYVVYSQKAELDQLKEGFHVLNFTQLVKSCPLLLMPLFVKSGLPHLTARSVFDLFVIHYSPVGSNRRNKEEELVLHWNYYISGLEGDREFVKVDGETIVLTLGDFLAFVTGADHPPPLGFENSPQIEFTNNPTRVLPKSSTCSLTLYLSVCISSYDDFVSKMDLAIISSPTFGTP